MQGIHPVRPGACPLPCGVHARKPCNPAQARLPARPAACPPALLLQATVLRCGLHSVPGSLPFTFYPAMPGNSTAAPAEKWEHQRPAMAALMGPAAADACFRGATT